MQLLNNEQFNGKIYNDFFMDNGIIHLGYSAKEVSDIVNHYSVDGLETVNGEFSSWINEMITCLPSKRPVAMEIAGKEFSEQEQSVIRRAIWNYYHKKLAILKSEMRSVLIKQIFIFVSFILSCIFLFISRTTTMLTILQEQYVALPFWFFGYRVLDFIIFSFPPKIKEIRTFTQMANMAVFFSGVTPISELSSEMSEKLKLEYQNNINASESTNYRTLYDNMILTDGRVQIHFKVESVAEIVPPCNFEGYELLNEEFKDYLYGLSYFFSRKNDIDIHIAENSFTEKEKESVKRALYHTMKFEMANADYSLKMHFLRVIELILLLAVSSFLIYKEMAIANVLTSEVLYLLFWFFADYLVEYIILNPIEAIKNRIKAKQFKNANIVFDEIN